MTFVGVCVSVSVRVGGEIEIPIPDEDVMRGWMSCWLGGLSEAIAIKYYTEEKAMHLDGHENEFERHIVAGTVTELNNRSWSS